MAQQELPKTIAVDLGSGVKLELVRIPAGKFIMGSPNDEEDRQNDEVQHEVIISQPFYLGKYEVTQEQYEAVTGKNPSSFSANGSGKAKAKVTGKDIRRFPVEAVSWDDAAAFCWVKLNEQQPQKGWRFELPKEFRRATPYLVAQPQQGWQFALPTEAQWEYACLRGDDNAVSLREQTERPRGELQGQRPARWDERQGSISRTHLPRWQLRAECLGTLRHTWQCVGTVRGLVHPVLEQRAAVGLGPSPPGRLLVPQCQGLPRGGPRQAAPGYRNYGVGFRVALVPSESK